MATEDHTEDEDVIPVWITPTIEADYRRRNVFDCMWSNRADKTFPNGQFLHKRVYVEFVQELIDDAKAQRGSDSASGIKKAYTSLRQNLERDIRAVTESVTILNPGHDAILKMVTPSPARFKVGDAAMIYRPDYESHGTLVEIVFDHRLVSVYCDDGKYRDKDGRRLDYVYAYSAKSPGDDVYLWLAYQLRDPDGKVRHIRLVK